MTGTLLSQYVSILQGTASTRDYSNGNTLPLMAAPFGMTHWSVETDEGAWFFHPDSTTFKGIRATHQPSPWIGDYGHFSMLPQTGDPYVNFETNHSYYRRDESEFRPCGFAGHLSRYNTDIKFAPTARCSILQMSFPADVAKRFLLRLYTGEGQVKIDPTGNCISGYTCTNRGGVPENFKLHYVIHFDQPMVADESGIILNNQLQPTQHHGIGYALGASVEFSPEVKVVHARIATSFISVEQAWTNGRTELNSKSFDDVQAVTCDAWESHLGRVELHGNESEHTKGCLYSALYRSLLFPRMFHEMDAEGNTKHYSAYDGKVHDGPACADNGFWDTSRTVYSLLALLYPDELEWMLEGWINAYREGGWFPKWSSPGYQNCMIGTHIDAVFADAYAKGIPFDLETAYEGLRKNAFVEPDGDGEYGRVGLAAYHELGYIPADEVKEAASRTMDAAYNDWCVLQLAEALGRDKDIAVLQARIGSYKNIFDCDVGFMRGRNRNGSWHEPFSPTRWGSPFVEGSVWQCGWAVQHDPQGLIDLFGGAEATVAKLDTMLSMAPTFEVGYYEKQIHEMAEMAAVDFGQYAHSNQPSHHILYFYALAGAPEKTQHWVRRVMTELYDTSPTGLSGDEDNGEMSAWFVMNALGIYSFCPGSEDFMLGSPLVEKAVLRMPTGELQIEAAGNGPRRVCVTQANFNGQCLERTVSAKALKGGGTLAFDLEG